MIKIAPSILSANFADIGGAVARLESWGADWVHFDVMDGNFVPNITFGPAMCAAVRPLTQLPLDVHLMTLDPEKWVHPFRDAGADIITIHVEADRHLHRTLQKIHDAGAKAGVVLNPATPVSSCEHVLADCDLVLIMSVNPGFGGQKFIPEAVEKIARLRKLAAEHNPELLIEVDGGINPETSALCRAAGATVIVAGNAVFTADDPQDMIARIRGDSF
ncbi:MAG: ribulose-phosphate 3-epimerase [Clostridiales bacterium]|nr:ribulose-phosphate 3-epimerase [Clostridiales bacterium]